MSAQIRHAARNTTNGESPVVSLVSALFNPRRPLAILGFVIAVVVYSFNGQSSRAFSHVFQEVLELHPPFADLDAATAVIVVPASGGLKAPPQHGTPFVVHSRMVPRWSVTMNNIGISCALSMQASAGFANPRTNVTSGDHSYGPAFTCAFNNFSMRRLEGDFPPSKLVSDQRYSGRHNDVRTIVVFSGSRRYQPDDCRNNEDFRPLRQSI